MTHATKRECRVLKALLFSTTAALTATLCAQTATAPDATKEETDILVLSPFVVTSEGEQGYSAQSTLAGTRVRTDVRDVGSAISIVTKQFLEDTGSTNAEHALVLTTNTEVAGQGGNFIGAGDGARAWGPERASTLSTTRVRGLDDADNTRDFFLSVIPWDTYNTGGLDIQRGPNSVLFGIGSPAGIINARINPASFQTSRTVEARFDNFGTRRFSGDFNQVLIPQQLSVRVALLDDRTKYRQEPSYRDDKRIYGALRWAPDFFSKNDHRTDVRINAEKGDIERVDPMRTPPNDLITPWFTRMGKRTYAAADSASLISTSAANFDPNVTRGVHGFAGNGLWAVFDNPNATAQSGLFASNADGAGVNLVGISPFAIYAGSANIAGNQVGSALYKDKSLTDRSIFDFYENNLYGENMQAAQDFDTFNAALSQTFFSDRFGIEVAYDKQKSEFRNRHTTGGAGYAISVDIMNQYADGSPNPNVGRPMALAGQYSNSNRSNDDRETLRATAFADLKAEHFMDRESLLTRILGRHVFTGSASRFERDIQSFNWNNVYTATTDPRYPTGNVDSDSHRVSHVTYLGASLLGANSPQGISLPRISVIQVPQSGMVRHYTRTTDSWNNVNVPVVNANAFSDEDRPYQGGRKLRDRVDSQVLVWQGYFLDGTIIPMVGWRRDKATTQDAGTVKRTQGIANLSDPNWRLPTDASEDGGAYARSYAQEEGETKTYSIVARTPRSWLRSLPGQLDFSVFYNQSENFRPLPGRRTYVGDAVSSPTGTTKEYGVMMSALDGKVNLKINRYRTKAQNVSLDGSVLPGWMLGYEAVFREAALQYKYGASWRADTVANSWIPVYGLTSSASPYGAGKQVIWEPDPARKQGDGTWSSSDLDAMYDLMIKSADAMLANPIPLKMQQAWGMTSYENGAGSNREVNYSGYGVALVGNTESEGTEFELTATPIKGLDISLNASKTDARRLDVGKDLTDFILSRYELFKNTPAGRLRIWGGGAWSDAPGGSDTPLTGYSNFMVPGYRLAVALNGTTVPELRPWRFNAVVNYAFQNAPLKGLNVGGAYRWQDRQGVGFAFNDDRTGYDIDGRMYGPKEDSLDLWIGYRRQLTRAIAWRVQLNVRDVLASDKLIPVSRQPDGSPAAYRLPEPRLISLTNTFSF